MISLLITKLAAMMLFVVIGLLIVRFKVVPKEDARSISTLMLYVLTPCLILNAFRIDLTREKLNGFIVAAIVGILAYSFWIILTEIIRKIRPFSRVAQATMIYANMGNLILPLVNMVFGQEMVFYASAMQIPFNLFLWTHAETIISGRPKVSIRKMLLNINVISTVIGISLMLIGFQYPDVLATTIEQGAGVVGPMSMITIGMTIADADYRKILTTPKSYIVVLGRLIFMPLSAMLILYATGFLRLYPQYIPVLQIVFIALSSVPAAMVSQLAIYHGRGAEEAASYNVLATLFCLVTMPFMAGIYQMLF